MASFDRRGFLGTTLGGLTALSLGPHLLGQEQFAGGPAGSPPPSPFDSLILTWRRDPTTTMTVQWVGPEVNDDTSIQFSPIESDTWHRCNTITKPFTGTDLKVFRCELEGLASGTEYKFQIGANSTEHRFRTMPARLTNEFCFVSGGDAGTGEHAINSNILAAKQEPNFVLIAGDLAYDNGRSPETFLEFMHNYTRTMIDPQGRLIPLVGCFGNHEVDGGYGTRREGAPSFLSLFDGLFAEKSFGVLDVGDYLSLVLLDSGHMARISGEQTDWLAKALQEREDLPHVIAVNHVPCYPSYRNPEGRDSQLGVGEEQRRNWCPLFEKHRVDLVLEHHDHTFKRTHPLTDGHIDKNGVVYLGDGSWGKLRVPKTPEERPYLAKVSEAYHVTLHRLEGDERFHIALEDTGRVADVTITRSKRAARRG